MIVVKSIHQLQKETDSRHRHAINDCIEHSGSYLLDHFTSK